MINLFYFGNNSSSSIYTLLLYWLLNIILVGVNLIQSGINLQ